MAGGDRRIKINQNPIDILTTMRRWIAILLIFVLPLQLSWAVAANYCQDEQSAGSQHFGHHAHVHENGLDAAQSLAKGTPQVDSDCGCSGHLCGAHFLPAVPDVLPRLTPMQQLIDVVPRAYRSSDPPRIERPNWPVSL